MTECAFCKKEVTMPYRCSYCDQYLCDEHRLPERHLCPALPKIRENWKDIRDSHYRSVSEQDKNVRDGISIKSIEIITLIIILLIVTYLLYTTTIL
jgi:predicted nucleic acid binding AN1-type Zn finger protein